MRRPERGACWCCLADGCGWREEVKARPTRATGFDLPARLCSTEQRCARRGPAAAKPCARARASCDRKARTSRHSQTASTASLLAFCTAQHACCSAPALPPSGLYVVAAAAASARCSSSIAPPSSDTATAASVAARAQTRPARPTAAAAPLSLCLGPVFVLQSGRVCLCCRPTALPALSQPSCCNQPTRGRAEVSPNRRRRLCSEK